MKALYVTFVRPVGSRCWTAERLANTPEGADCHAVEERNRKVRFADGSVHLQSTATVCVLLPEAPDDAQQHYDPDGFGKSKLGIA